MPGLVAPDQDEIDSWGIEELGVKDGTSPTVNFDAGGTVATREFLCNWTKRYDVARWFTGAVDTYFDGSTKKISRLNPQQLPLPPGAPLWVPRLHATKITEMTGHAWRDFDPGGYEYGAGESFPDAGPEAEGVREYQFTGETVNRFQCAKLKVQYERLPYTLIDDEEGDPELSRNVQYIPEEGQPDYLTIPSSTQLYLDPAGGLIPGIPAGHLIPVPYPVGITESVYRFCLRWHRIPKSAYGIGSALNARIFGDGTTSGLPYLNAVNKVPFYFGRYPPGTVMLEKVTEKLDPSLLDSEDFLWTIDYHFAVKPAGWNTSWFFPNTKEFAGAANAAKRMLVGRGVVYFAPGSVPDLYSNYIERDLEQLFNVDDVV